jgi:tetratricopeptide (TPR) repeat protein
MQQLSIIVDLLKNQQFELAVQQCKAALSINNHPQLHLFLGIAYGELGRINEARPCFNKLISHFPKNLEIQFNYALILEKNNLLNEAIGHYETCLSLDPNHLLSLRNLSFLYFKQQNFYPALKHINHLLKFQQNDPFLHNLKGLVHMDLKQTNIAIDCFNTALNLKPNEAEYLFNKATAQALSGHNSKLKDTLEKITKIGTNEAISFVASIYEKSNLLDESLKVINEGLEKYKNSPELYLTHAKILKQKKLYDEALSSLNKIQTFPNSQFQQESLYEKAGLHDKLKNYAKAWQVATIANKESLKDWQNIHPEKDTYNQVCYEIKDCINKFDTSKINPINDSLNRDIAFILGFTRSGTTLIDSILSSHSEIEVLEEIPLIRDLTNQFQKSSPTVHFNQLLSVTNEQKIHLRKRYFEQMPKYLTLSNSRLLIDKSPLNTSLVAFIKTIFPEAKIIFSIRHPLDVCVSCFFQQFEFNSYMTNMVSPTKIAYTYDAILSVWKQSVEKFNIDVHYQRYESLVTDFESQSKALVDYTGLDWQDQMLNFQSSLKSRAVIPNPSYNQVSQPIYQTAKNRYKNYQTHLGEAIEILEPWFQYFDYKV